MTMPPTGRPETPPGVAEALADVEALLDRIGVSWTRAGAFAAGEYRPTPRYTTDADVLVEWHEDIPAALAHSGFEFRTLYDAGEPYLIRTRRGEAGVDLMVAVHPYQHQAIRRGLRTSLTIEDVLIHKLIAWRPKDRDDIAAILTSGLDFDRAYVELWIAEAGFEGNWQEAQTWA